MQTEKYKVLGHEVQYNVPASSEEFNSLPHDPKVADPCLEEAKANIVYRSMNPDTRYLFLHGRSQAEVDAAAKETPPKTLSVIQGVEEQVEEMTKDITDVASLGMKYADGEVANSFARRTKVSKNKKGEIRKNEAGEEITTYDEPEEQYYNRVLAGLVAAKKFASEDAARAHFQTSIETIALEVPFDIMNGPREARGPKKLAAKYKLQAAKIIVAGTVDSNNTNVFQPSIGKTYTLTNDTTKMFNGVIPADGRRFATDTNFSVSDKDAEGLGWIVKEFVDWKANQSLDSME